MSPETKQTVLAALLASIIPILAVLGGAYLTITRVETKQTAQEAAFNKAINALTAEVAELNTQLNRSSLQSGVWHVLNQNTNDIVKLQTEVERFKKISNETEIQVWGYHKRQVPANESSIAELISEVTVLKAHVQQLRLSPRNNP